MNTPTTTERVPSVSKRARWWRRTAAVFTGGLAVLTVVAIVLVSPPTVVASPDEEGAYKAAHDTDPHLPLTAFQQSMLAEKQAAVAELFAAQRVAAGRLSVARATAARSRAAVTADTVLAAGPLPDSDFLIKNQVPQGRSYWCGPATIREALGQVGYVITQARAADELGTTVSGTPWSGGVTRTGFPMADVMNAHQSRNYYVPKAVPYPPSDLAIQQYRANLVATIYDSNAPVIGNAWTTPASRYYLNGHPDTIDIRHWFDIRGYSESGAYTHYEDSVSGSDCGIAWAWRVPPYSRQPSGQIMWIVSGRGYLW